MTKLIYRRFWAVFLPLAMLLAQTSYGAGRSVQAVDLSLSRGQTNRLSIRLESQGDENALKFSLCYDPALLTFIGAARGTDATNAGATMNVNTDIGQLGFTLALPP